MRYSLGSCLVLALCACGSAPSRPALSPPVAVVAAPPAPSPLAPSAEEVPAPQAAESAPPPVAPPVQLSAVSVGQRAFLGGTVHAEAFPGCAYELQIPELTGLADQALQQRINAGLEGGARAEARDFCLGAPPDADPAWSLTRQFEVDVARGDLVSIRYEVDSYTGGAHGAQSTECEVLDLLDGTSFQLEAKLLPARRARLAQQFKQKVRNSDIVRQAKADGMPLEDVDLDVASAFCADQDGFFVQLGSYTLGPYSLGRPTFAFSSEEARPFFGRALSDRLFPR